MKGQEVKIKPLPFMPLLFHFDPGCEHFYSWHICD